MPVPDMSLLPEWAPQQALWTAWPASAEEWNGDLEAPRCDVAALVRALAPGNRVRLLAHGTEALASATHMLGGLADVVPATYGDIWVRDTGPLFATSPQGPRALRFRTNGWGGKFLLPGDETVGNGPYSPPDSRAVHSQVAGVRRILEAERRRFLEIP